MSCARRALSLVLRRTFVLPAERAAQNIRRSWIESGQVTTKAGISLRYLQKAQCAPVRIRVRPGLTTPRLQRSNLLPTGQVELSASPMIRPQRLAVVRKGFAVLQPLI